VKNGRLSRVWLIIGVTLLVAAGLLLTFVYLVPRSASPEPTMVPPTAAAATPSPSVDAEPSPAATDVAASVDGYTITQSYLSTTVRLNRVLGALSGAPVLGERETLERLIRSQLILQGAPSADEPTDDEVESFISSLQRSWGVSDEAMVERLEAEGVDRAFFEETVKRLLTVQAAVDSLESEGHNLSEWLMDREQDAEIFILDDLADVGDADLEEAEEEPVASPTTEIIPATENPTAEPEVPETAPTFTLDIAGGGRFSLDDHLADGPVVLVFFERCA